MLFVNILLSFTTLIAFLLSMLIIVSNPRKRTNQALFAMTATIFVWLLANLLTNLSPTPEMALFFARSTLIGGALIPYTFLIFCEVYLGDNLTKSHLIKWGILPMVIILTTPTSLNIVSIDVYGANTITGNIYLLLIIELLVYFSIGLWKLFKKYTSKQTRSLERSQLRYILAGAVTAIVPIFIINAAVPVLYPDSTAIFYGPNAIIFLALFTSLAIIKHRFLDIRLIVARSLGYVLLLSSLVATYSILVIVFTEKIPLPDSLEFVTKAIPFIAAIIVALSFGPLKKFFDRLTNKYFYQDAYEPQNLLNDLNQILVSSIDVDVIIRETSLIIERYLKPSYVNFYIRKDEDSPKKLFSTTNQNENNKEIYHVIQKFSDKVTLVSDDNKLIPSVRQQATALDIGLVALLLSTNQRSSLRSGSIVLGPKKSGSIYNRQDLRVMEIIADELVIAIQNALRFEEIQQFNVTLQKKVDDATKELKKANEKLIALDQTKDDFISMASHQLRTPLTSVKGYISMVVEGDVGKISKQQHKLLDQAFLSSQRMVYLIADLLNVSRLKTGKFIIEPKPTNLADLVEGELSQLTETAKSRDLTLDFEKPANFPLLMLDDTKTRQVVMNFADNAIYYTMSGGKIDVIVEDTGKTIEFTVTDNGIGVPKNERHNLFSKFYRANNAKKARPDGTGLGLFMAKKVIIAQGGSIIFKSEEGKGSTFGFSFDKARLKVPDTKIDKHNLDK